MPADVLEIDLEAPETVAVAPVKAEIPVETVNRVSAMQDEALDQLQLQRFEEFMDPRTNSNNG